MYLETHKSSQPALPTSGRRDEVDLQRASLPERGLQGFEVLGAIERTKIADYDWKAGRLPLYVYWRGEEAHRVSRDAYMAYFVENGMGKRAFPSVQTLERDVVDMALNLLGAPGKAGGSFTTGGTESIFQAVKSARDFARDQGRLPVGTKGTIVVPRSAHPAFNKAAKYLDLREVRIPLGPDLRVDLGALSQAIDKTTVLIVGSAPNFPHGVFDDIASLSAIAMARDIWLHVDACVGGMLAPFMRQIGESIPPFDFELPGVTTLSVDLHKYGYAAKGASLVLYRDGARLRYQRYEFDDWPRGFYGTDSFLGTRSGGPVASAWAVMNYLGIAGYTEGARVIRDLRKELVSGIKSIAGLTVLEQSTLSFVLYLSEDPSLDINAVAEGMSSRGWFIGRSVDPSAIHLMLNPVHAHVLDKYLVDLREVVADVRQSGATGTLDANTY